MTATMTGQVPDADQRSGLSARLQALDRLVQAGASRSGPDGFSEELLGQANDLLTRAGQRLMLSSSHTVVSLAGGTGSGKSSLFNRLAGADFSTVGVTRPVTSEAHACVWGVSGTGPLMEWLGIPRRYRYARASALSSGEESLAGLVLLDLPDHDSVMGHATDLVDHLVGHSDLIVWVLDPQKYADMAVHRRFLVPLAGHSEVVAVVLNQADLLPSEQIEDCVHDLRRLLDSEQLHDVQILVTSAKTGAGLDELRRLLVSAVTARTAASARISADLDKIVTEFEPYGLHVARAAAAGEDEPSDTRLPAGTAAELAASFTSAAGVAAIGDALTSARELRAMDYVGWPVSWLMERLTSPDPVRKTRLGRLWAELRDITAGPTGAQQAEIDNALTDVADHQVPELPRPWSRTVRAAVRSRAGEIPRALGTEVGSELPDSPVVDRWWRAIGVLQGLLLGCVIVGIAWLVTVTIFAVTGAGASVPRLFTDPWLLPWAVIMIAGGLGLGWLTARICTTAVAEAARRESDLVLAEIRRRLSGVAHDYVITPAELELAELDRFRADLRIAAGN